MFFVNLINYCASYFTFVQTKIRLLNDFLKADYVFDDIQKIKHDLKDIVKDHVDAIQ